MIFACCFRPEAIRTVMNPNRQILQQLKIAIFFICNGGESDEWVDGVLSSIENKDVKVMKMMEYVPLRHEQSMDHDHEHDSHEDMDDDDEGHDHEEGRSMTSMSGLQSEMQSVCLPQSQMS